MLKFTWHLKQNLATIQTKNCSAPTIFELLFILVFCFPYNWTPVSKIFVALYNNIIIRSLHHNNVQTFLRVTVFVTSAFRVNLHSVTAWMSRNSLSEVGSSREHLASLAKWLGFRFLVLQLWVLISLQLLSKSILKCSLSE